MSSKRMINVFVYLLCGLCFVKCSKQIGPEPWDYDTKPSVKHHKEDIQLDLTLVPKKNSIVSSTGDWFYKRLLLIVLKGGHAKDNEDGSVDVSLHMKYSPQRWRIMEEYMLVNSALTEDMLRRSLAYIEDSIHKPTIIEKIAMAWGEYIQFYLSEYKIHIICIFSFLTVLCSTFLLWNHISRKHVIVLVTVVLYFYEVFVSYKEVESKELEQFMKAINTCKWYIWFSECEIRPPDPLIFIKHMNPLKIAIRLFSILISEPMITISETIKVILHGITDGLWSPLDTIVYGALVLFFNALLIFLLILIMYNYILNIPFDLNFLIMNVGFKQRNRRFITSDELPRDENVDRISAVTLTKILDVCSRALDTAQAPNVRNVDAVNTACRSTTGTTLKRSASTGRLPNMSTYEYSELNKLGKYKNKGGGDG